MNIQLKQRIVGVIIIVALIALLIPFLFVNKNKKDKNDTFTPVLPETQANQTMTVESPTEQKIEAPASVVGDSAKLTSDVVKPIADKNEQQANSASPITTPVTNATMPISPTAEVTHDDKSGADLAVDSLAKTTVETAASTSAAAIVKQEQNVMASPSQKHLDKKIKNLPNAKTAKPANKSDKSKKTTQIRAKSSANTVAVPGLWSVYLGDFPENEQGSLIKKMYDKGYRAYAKKSKTPDGTFVGIYVGHLRTQEQAEQLATELQKVTGFSGKAIKNPGK